MTRLLSGAFQQVRATHLRWFAVLIVAIDLVYVAFGWLAGPPYDNAPTRWDLVGTDTLIIGPLVAGAAAWLCHRDRFTLRDFVGAGPARRGTAAWTSAISLVGIAWVAHLVAVMLLALPSWVADSSHLPWTWALLPVAALGIILSYIGFGMVVGSLIRSSATPVIAAAVAFLWPFLSLALRLSQLPWAGGGGTGGNEAMATARVEVVLGQVAWGLGWLLVGVALYARADREVPRRSLLAGGVALALVAGGFLQTTPNNRFRGDDTPIAVTCTTSSPRVCLSAKYRVGIAPLQAMVDNIADEHRRLGMEPSWIKEVREMPLEVVLEEPERAPHNVRWLESLPDLGHLNWDDVESVEYLNLQTRALGILMPTKCREFNSYKNNLELHPFAQLFQAWVLTKPSLRDRITPLHRMNASARDAWLRKAWAANDTCRIPPNPGVEL